MTDASLARRATKGDQRAFAAIFDRYHQEIYRFCLSILGNAEDAREALQSTMLKALQALPGEEREIRLKPWLYRVAHNEAIDLVRKRRETATVDPELAAPGGGLAETVARRERLRQLLLDLGDLPDRQRAALVMRELGGLGFEQIAEAFDTSPATARQTVYEARVNLRSLEEGREMSCEEVMHRLSNADGRVNRRRDLNAHLRACPDCRAFREAIDVRRRDLAALAPLPAVASAGVLHAVLGGAQGAAGGATGTGGATVAASAGKAVSAGLLAKSAATVAVVAAIGVSAADRGGLIHTGLPGGSSDATPAEQTRHGAVNGSAGSPAEQSAGAASGSAAASTGQTHHGNAQGKGATPSSPSAGKGSDGHGEGSKEGQPPASHGRETASEHREGAAANHDQGHGGASTSHRPAPASRHGHHGGHVKPKGGSAPPRPQPSPAKPAPRNEPERSSTETAPEAERSSGSGSKGAESGL
jgi:RNA polymerase sigma factor (sigma-70 family)